MSKKIISLMLVLTVVFSLFNVVTVNAASEVLTDETSGVSYVDRGDGTNFYDIVLDSYFNVDTIGAAGDKVNSETWYGYDGTNGYAKGYGISSTNEYTTFSGRTYDSGSWAKSLDSSRDFKFRFNLETLSGGVSDAIAVTASEPVTVKLLPGYSNIIKIAVSNVGGGKNFKVKLNYADGTSAENAKTLSGSVHSNEYKGTYYKNQDEPMRAFSSKFATAITPVKIGTDENGVSSLVTGTKISTARYGWRGYEVVINNIKKIESVTLSSSDAAYPIRVYAIAQDSITSAVEGLVSAINIAQVEDVPGVIKSLNDAGLLTYSETGYEKFENMSPDFKKAISTKLIELRPEAGFADIGKVVAAYDTAMTDGILTYVNQATENNIIAVLDDIGEIGVIDASQYKYLDNEAKALVGAAVLEARGEGFLSMNAVSEAVLAAMPDTILAYANAITVDTADEVLTNLGLMKVTDTAEYVILDTEARAVTGDIIVELVDETPFTTSAEIVKAFDEAVAAGVVSYVNSTTEENAGAVIDGLGSSGILSDSDVAFDKYTALSDELKAQVNAEFYGIVSAQPVADYEGIKSAYKEAMNIAYISAIIEPSNFAVVHKQITSDKYGYGSYHDKTLGKNTTGSLMKTYVNKWEVKDFRGYNYANLYSKATLTEFYLPLKSAITDIKMNYAIAAEQNSNQTGFDVSFSPVKMTPDTTPAVYAATYTNSEGEEIVSETNEQFMAWYNFLADTAWTAAKSNIQSDYANIDITSKAVEPLKASESDYIIIRAGGASIYDGWRVKSVPKMKLVYDASAIMSYINDTSVASDAKIETLGVSGLLQGSTYGHGGFKGLTAVAQESIAAEITAKVSDGGYAGFTDFITSYDKLIEKQLANVVENPDVHITFDDGTEKNTGLNAQVVPDVKGDFTLAVGPDGSKALAVNNEYGAEAQNYLNLGKYSFGEDDFAIVFWMRAPNAGIGEFGHNPSASGSYVDFTNGGYSRGGVVFSNKDFSVNGNIGFAMAALPATIDFSVNTKIGESEVLNTVGIQSPAESRWHQIAYVVDREGYATTYVDASAVSTFKISESAGGIDGDGADLVFGADGLGQYGMIEGEFDDIRIYSIPLSSTVLSEMYYETMLDRVNFEAATMLSDEKANSIYSDDNKEALSAELAKSQKYADDYVMGNAAELKAKYDSFNDYYNRFLNKDSKGSALYTSDIHISGSSVASSKGLWMVKSLNQHKEFGIDLKTWITAGDYADTGNKHQHLFFNILDANIPEGVNAVVARGNHDEPANGSRTVVNEDGTTSKVSLTRGQLRQEFQDRMNKYFDSDAPVNASLKDENGNLNQPYYYLGDGIAHYIVIDNYTPNTRMVSDATFAWLESTLDTLTALKDGKPIFITQHLPLYDSVTSSTVGYYLYESYSEKLKELLNKYEGGNIFLFNGHTHSGFGGGTGTVMDFGNFCQVNMSAFGKNPSRGYPGTGVAYYINMYDDRVVFRARDFTKDEWLRDYDLTFMLGEPEEVVPTETLMGAIEIEGYDSVSSAAGKEVTVKVPVTVSESDAEYTAILGAYGEGMLKASAMKPVKSGDTFIEFEITVPEGAESVKVMLLDGTSTLIPVCNAVNK